MPARVLQYLQLAINFAFEHIWTPVDKSFKAGVPNWSIIQES